MVSGDRLHSFVEGFAKAQEFIFVVGQASHLIQIPTQVFDVIVGDLLARFERHLTFDYGANRVQLLRVPQIEGRDDDPSHRESIDESLGLQHVQGLTDRSSTDGQLIGHFELEESAAGRALTADDLFTNTSQHEFSTGGPAAANRAPRLTCRSRSCIHVYKYA